MAGGTLAGPLGRGIDGAIAGLEQPAPAHFARLNELKTDAARLAARWQEEGVEFEERRMIGPGRVWSLNSGRIRRWPTLGSFQDGWFYVQDPSTLLAARQLDPQPGETILDLCAAPGGKTTYLAQRMGIAGGSRPGTTSRSGSNAGGKLPPPRRDLR
jgi:16S rRNA C967 or C1407 C5-methylase (RsmB/RsmF family)